MRKSFQDSFSLALFIIKIVTPLYILADILYYYNVLSYISFLLEPFCSILGLPKEASLAIISGVFLNLYAAIAFAAPLDLSVEQWSTLAIFLGICHALVVENIIMAKLGISKLFSTLLRFFAGLGISYLSTFLPSSFFTFSQKSEVYKTESYSDFIEFILNSFYNASLLTLKIILLITIVVFIMNYIKSLPFITENNNNFSKYFSLIIGVFLGITYGAGLLINEVNNLEKKDILFISTFLMICHSIIEDTLLFVIFGADFIVVTSVRVIGAIFFAFLVVKLYDLNHKKNLMQFS